jgi:uncharacterized protein (DUF1778 family)
MATTTRKRDQRLEVRTTAEERALIDQAVSYAGTDLTSFAVSNLVDASRRVLADRTQFVLSPAAAKAWDRINELPAQELPGLRTLMRRPSPFVSPH